MAEPMTRDRAAVHDLKVWPEYFAALASGRKTFEVRKNDRGFQEGDTLLLREWSPYHSGGGDYTGRELTRRVGYILKGGSFGVPDDFVVMALTVSPAPPPRVAHSQSEYKRLTAQGADVLPPAPVSPEGPSPAVIDPPVEYARLLKLMIEQPTGEHYAAFLRIYAHRLRQGDKWDIPQTMAAAMERIAEFLSAEGRTPPPEAPQREFHEIHPDERVVRVYRDGSYLVDHKMGQRERRSFWEAERGTPPTCVWTHEFADYGDSDIWQTQCGNTHQFTEGGPTENQQKFCGYCGKVLVEQFESDTPAPPPSATEGR